MGTMILQSQIGALENGLKDLRKSRLMQIREFKDMYGAIENHHRDLRLAHLTGKAKDLMVQAQQDTRFFHILIKMMCEVKQTSSMKQKDSLIKVHHWYTSNKHILHTAPEDAEQSVWVISQRYNSVLKDLREQTKWLCMFYTKDRDSFDNCLRENDVIPTLEERQRIKEELKKKKHRKLILKTDQPTDFWLLD
ncbi:unnamed protein product [Mytilus coruscus]|uniref:Uncharacterized protein n=1 Tax=Mytilus coruscus TaxID=42192 RepID=A0A6J8EQB1_MYTCO|nr:unnamed protein product [Mytilus coruscus]